MVELMVKSKWLLEPSNKLLRLSISLLVSTHWKFYSRPLSRVALEKIQPELDQEVLLEDKPLMSPHLEESIKLFS